MPSFTKAAALVVVAAAVVATFRLEFHLVMHRKRIKKKPTIFVSNEKENEIKKKEV